MNYVNSEEYQKEVEEQYKKRVADFSIEEVVDIVTKLGFEITSDEVVRARAGNAHATYITNDYVIKITKEKGRGYLPNKIISDAFPDKPVVHVLRHDVFEKTDYEVLVMKKSIGNMLQDDILKLDKTTIELLFSQTIDVINMCTSITSNTFGFVANPETQYVSFKDLQVSRIGHYLEKIRSEKIIDEESISKIENYFNRYASLIDGGNAVLVHRDAHMGNVLHDDKVVTAVVDWDSAQFAPKYAMLPTLLGFIDNPAQFVEGTPYYESFKDVRFEYLLPILKEKLPEVFNDEQLLLKLNLFGIVEGLMWVSQNWSESWNKQMINKLIAHEIPEDLGLLTESYYGKILQN